MELTLSSGKAVTLRDPKRIKERDRRALKLAYFDLDAESMAEVTRAAESGTKVQRSALKQADIVYLQKLNDVALVALIEKMTDEQGRPVELTKDMLQDLDMVDYGEISAAAAPLIEAIDLDFSPTPVGVESPTAPVSA